MARLFFRDILGAHYRADQDARLTHFSYDCLLTVWQSCPSVRLQQVGQSDGEIKNDWKRTFSRVLFHVSEPLFEWNQAALAVAPILVPHNTNLPLTPPAPHASTGAMKQP